MFLSFNGSADGVLRGRVHALQMLLELATDAKLTQAVAADVRPVRASAEVPVHVLAEVFGARERLGARRARVRLIAVVQLDVSTQVPDAREQHVADAAAELHHAVRVTYEVRLRVLHVVRLH